MSLAQAHHYVMTDIAIEGTIAAIRARVLILVDPGVGPA